MSSWSCTHHVKGYTQCYVLPPCVLLRILAFRHSWTFFAEWCRLSHSISYWAECLLLHSQDVSLEMKHCDLLSRCEVPMASWRSDNVMSITNDCCFPRFRNEPHFLKPTIYQGETFPNQHTNPWQTVSTAGQWYIRVFVSRYVKKRNQGQKT